MKHFLRQLGELLQLMFGKNRIRKDWFQHLMNKIAETEDQASLCAFLSDEEFCSKAEKNLSTNEKDLIVTYLIYDLHMPIPRVLLTETRRIKEYIIWEGYKKNLVVNGVKFICTKDHF